MSADHSEERALIRAIRLGRPDDAMYWGYRLERATTASRFHKILLNSALYDNLHIETLMNVAHYERIVRLAGHKDIEPMALVARLACTQKLWSVDLGRKMVRIICAVQSDCSYKTHSGHELLQQLSAALGEGGRLANTIRMIGEICARSKNDRTDLYEYMVAAIAEKARSTAVAQPLEFLREEGRKRTAADDRWLYVAAAWLTGDMWGQDFTRNPDDLLAREFDARPVPVWASATDRRFEAGWDAYANMCLMFEEHGQLDPDDQGILFKIRSDGSWFPLIKEEAGVYLVQSEREPRKFYEVNLSVMSCTCESYMRRLQPCKHITAATEYLYANLPFNVA